MIEAELEVLMQAFAERLSQILAQDPERFAEIVAGMDAVAVEALARLLRRLGQEAIGVVLACTFDAEDAVVRVNALALLKALVAQDMFLAGGIILLIGWMTVVGTFLSDLLLVWADPRVKFEGR